MYVMPERLQVLVTGASRGIGRACSVRFAAAGHEVTALARTEAQLKELQKSTPGILPLIADLTAPFDLASTYDVVVLNAGYYAPGGLLDPDRDIFADSWPLNVMANHRLARLLVPRMLERGGGHLIAIGSTSTDDTSPQMTAYAATKKALRALYEGWQQELVETQVRTTLIAPGATLTSSWDGEVPPAVILQPEEVADLVYRAVSEKLTGRLVIKAGDQS